MSDARTTAWHLLKSAANSSDEDLSRAAIGWAKVNGYAAAATATPQRVASGERSAVAGDGMVMPFGRDKGKRLGDLDERSLLWWKAVYERDVADEAKASYLARNQAALDAVNERLADFRRGEP